MNAADRQLENPYQSPSSLDVAPHAPPPRHSSRRVIALTAFAGALTFALLSFSATMLVIWAYSKYLDSDGTLTTDSFWRRTFLIGSLFSGIASVLGAVFGAFVSGALLLSRYGAFICRCFAYPFAMLALGPNCVLILIFCYALYSKAAGSRGSRSNAIALGWLGIAVGAIVGGVIALCFTRGRRLLSPA